MHLPCIKFKIVTHNKQIKMPSVSLFTWGIIEPPTADLLYVVSDVKMIISSQDGYAGSSSKAVDFAVNNLGLFGILKYKMYLLINL